MATELFKFEDEPVHSYSEVIEKVTEVVMKPNLKIALGSGKVIFELVRWLKDNVNNEKCRGIIVYCSSRGQVSILNESGVNAHLGVPDETGEFNERNQLDYFFEMPERMNEDFTFVKFSNECAHRKQLFALAKQSIFFYMHPKNELFQRIKAIPLEMSRGYYQHLKRTLNSCVTALQHPRKNEETEMIPEVEDENVVKMDWIWDSNSTQTTDITPYCTVLDRIHGLIAHGLYQYVDGHLIKLSREEGKVLMSSMILKVAQEL